MNAPSTAVVPSWRIGRSILALLAGIMVGIVLSTGTDFGKLCHRVAGSQPSYGPLAGGRGVGIGGEQSWRCRRMEHYNRSTLVSSSACSDGSSHCLDWRKALAHAVTLANRGCRAVRLDESGSGLMRLHELFLAGRLVTFVDHRHTKR